MRTAAIYGCSGPSLTADERTFFSDARPWGFILFARNVRTPDQVRALVAELRGTVGDDRAPVLIDQEGGRVARLRPPHWRERPPAARFGALYAQNPDAGRLATYLNARLIARDLSDLGINVDCLPVLDVPVPGAHDIIGDRAFAHDPAAIIALGRAQIDGLLDGGVLPVMKHIPGHGRAGADSHLSLPRVAAAGAELAAGDFVTFRALNTCPLAMTAHVVYEAIDPQAPATLSAKVLRQVVRGAIGFDGLLMSDDLSMQALDGPLSARAKAAFAAGCDLVLHCNGDMKEMTDVASETRQLNQAAARRSALALARLNTPGRFDAGEAEARLARLLAGAGAAV